MHISRCRYWWCSRCQAVFEKEELSNKLLLYGGTGEVTILGTRECAHCHAVYEVRDIYAGKHDVPREHWGQLQQPIELPGEAEPPSPRRKTEQEEPHADFDPTHYEAVLALVREAQIPARGSGDGGIGGAVIGQELGERLKSFFSLVGQRGRSQLTHCFFTDADYAKSLVIQQILPGEALIPWLLSAEALWKKRVGDIGGLWRLAGADLSTCHLSSAALDRACLARANLSHTMGIWMHLEGADLSGANLRDCWWFGPLLSQAILRGANLTNSAIGDLTITGDWRHATLTNAVLDLRGVQEPDLTGADFTGCRVRCGSTQVRQAFLARLSKEQRAQAKLKSACFIATACCKDEMAWQLETLRAFRDQTLTHVPGGRRIISLYERISPPIAQALESHMVLRNLVRVTLVTPAACLAKCAGAKRG